MKFKFIQLFTLFFLFSLIYLESADGRQLFLNEVMSSNSITIRDDDGDYPDWIEIVNLGDEPIKLLDYGLSDDYDTPFQWVFPDTTIQPGSYFLVWASNKNRSESGRELHTNFAIASAGEEVILTHPDGTRLDELPPTEIPTDISIGRQPDGIGDWVYFDEPTPGMPNSSEPITGLLEAPVFSHNPGFYTEEFDLEIFHPEVGVTVYYTLDGSVPTANSLVYERPIRIRDRSNDPNVLSRIPTTNLPSTDWKRFRDPRGRVMKSTTVRTLTIKSNHKPVQKSASYFVSTTGRQLHELPVVSIMTNHENLFDHHIGIYVPGRNFRSGRHDTGNYFERGDAWEREAVMEFFDKEGIQQFSQNVGIRIHGGWNRRLPQKSLRIYARNQYGKSHIEFPIFPDEPYDRYKRLILRNSGNDYGFTLMRDATAQMMVSHFNLDTQAYQPSVLYINGEYWGIHNIRERYDRHYLERVYGINPDNIDLLTGRWSTKEGNNHEYASLLAYIDSNDMSSNHHYNYITTKIDIDNFIDYYVAQIYFANIDWPQNNVDFWRVRRSFDPEAEKGHDGRWRWLLYDVDYSLGFTNLTTGFISDERFDMINWVMSERNLMNNQRWPGQIFRRLMNNDQFKFQFINQIADHLNTSFEINRAKSIIEYNEERIKSEITNHSNRWNHPSSFSTWESNIEVMYRFVENRPEFLRSHVMNHFGINSTTDITVEFEWENRDVGSLYVNSLRIDSNTEGLSLDSGKWTGTYFSGIPLQFEAITGPGYFFSHWIIDGADTYHLSDRVTIQPETFDRITPVFMRKELKPIDPFDLNGNEFELKYWSMEEDPGSYPESMAFVFMDDTDPGLNAEPLGNTSGAYNLESRTRINGLGDDGFSFVNTSNLEGNPGYPGRRLGGAILSLNTQGQGSTMVEWAGGTVDPGSRIYHLRLQYRIGSEGEFEDVMDRFGYVVEYRRNEEPGHNEQIGPIQLPPETDDQPEVQLMWRYYYTGVQEDVESGQRSELNVSSIKVWSYPLMGSEPGEPQEFRLYQNYPNPFYPQSTIRYDLPREQHVRLDLFTITGQFIQTLVDGPRRAGRHSVPVDASSLASGVYIYRLVSEEYNESGRMSVIK